MIDKLLDFIIEFATDLLPFVIIKHYKKGVRLRFGKKRCRVDEKQNDLPLEPGLHWKLPFFDEILVHLVKPTTLELDEQTITTRDSVSIVVKGVIKYEVSDVVKLLLEVDTPVDALKDMSKGIIRNTLIVKDWKDCNDPDLSSVMQDKIRSEAKSWGIKVLKVTLTDLAKMTSIRLLNSSNDKKCAA